MGPPRQREEQEKPAFPLPASADQEEEEEERVRSAVFAAGDPWGGLRLSLGSFPDLGPDLGLGLDLLATPPAAA